MEKTASSGLWLFRGALRGGDVFCSLLASCDWVKKGSYHTAWSVLPLSACSCSYSYGQGPAEGPQTGERCWSLLTGLCRAVAPLMQPWFAKVEMPTAGEDPLIRPYRWLGPYLVPPSPFLRCDDRLTPCGCGVLADPARIDEEFRKAWLPYFCRSGQREASLEEFNEEVVGPEIEMPRLTGQMLADVFLRKGATAGSLDGWVWRELKVLPVARYDELARILSLVEDAGVWPDCLLDACNGIIPKVGGDSTPLGQRPHSVLPVVYRIWASARMQQLEGWFRSWVPVQYIVLGMVGAPWRLGTRLLLILKRF